MAIWSDAQPAEAHEYLTKKGVAAHGLRVDDEGRLLVPVFNSDDPELRSLQLIQTDGEKRFLTGSSPAGGCLRISPEPAYHSVTLGAIECVYVAEGYATAASIYEATGCRVLVAFSATNMATVARDARAAWPDAGLVVAADHDEHGKGREAAEAAARAADARVAMPDEPGDFNDLHVRHGIEAVRAALEAHAAEPTREAPVIRVQAGALSQTVHDAIGALQSAGAPIYDQGGRLVRPLRLEASEDDGSVRRPAGALTIAPVTSSWLRLRLAEAATFERYYVKDREWHAIDPPSEVAGTIANNPDEGSWPPLRAVVQTPVLWPDGSWSGAPGYRNRLLIDVGGDWPEPGNTRAEAEQALATLRHHLRFMAWASATDESVGLSLLLTAILRPTLDSAPLHAVDAPAAGSGKSLLVDAAATLATGAQAAVMDFGRDADEAAKRLDSALIAGDSIVNIDNVDAALEGAALCTALTQRSRRVRILGESTVVTVPCSALITATGNNLVVRGDLCRRTVTCRLDAQTDRPDRRKIEQDLIADTRERRGELVAAAQTIVRAYLHAGLPDLDLPALGLFHDWSARVRAPLVWLGLPDPAQTVDRTIDEDPDARAFYSVLAAWREALGGSAVTASDLIEEANHDDDLYEALANVCLVRGELDNIKLGRWLRDHRDSRTGSMVLQRANRKKNVSKWMVATS